MVWEERYCIILKHLYSIGIDLLSYGLQCPCDDVGVGAFSSFLTSVDVLCTASDTCRRLLILLHCSNVPDAEHLYLDVA